MALTDVYTFYCFYFVCVMPLKLSGLRHVNLDIYNNNNNNNNNAVEFDSATETASNL